VASQQVSASNNQFPPYMALILHLPDHTPYNLTTTYIIVIVAEVLLSIDHFLIGEEDIIPNCIFLFICNSNSLLTHYDDFHE